MLARPREICVLRRFRHCVGAAWIEKSSFFLRDFLHAILKRDLNDVGLHHLVLIDEVGGVDVIDVDASYLG